MTNNRLMGQHLSMSCNNYTNPSNCTTSWSLSTKYQQPCNYVSAHSSFNDALVAMDKGIANVQVSECVLKPASARERERERERVCMWCERLTTPSVVHPKEE